MPEGGLNIRWPDTPLAQEERLHRYKLYAALAFARANGLDKVVFGSPKRRLGIITTGKTYLDVRQALDDLGIDEAVAAEIGVAVYKVALTWPLEREGVRHFAEGLDEILVIEEKRAVIENQLKEQLYNWRADVRPRVIGKFDENRDWILPSPGELTPGAHRPGHRPAHRPLPHQRSDRGAPGFSGRERSGPSTADSRRRSTAFPYFCSGCPHNTSTKLPEGSRALAGIGCHYMVQWMDRSDRDLHPDGRRGRATGSARRPSRRPRTCSPTWATAPTTTPASWRSAPVSPPASTSPSSCSTTTPSP